MIAPRHLSLLTALCCLCTAVAALAQEEEWNPALETAVVFNPEFPESEALAQYYVEKRGIPADHLLAIPCSKEEAISREAFNDTIAPAMRKAFIDRHWFETQLKDVHDPASGKTLKLPVVEKSHIKYLVLMHGMPSKIIRQHESTKPSQEDEASVDSELAALGLPVTKLAGLATNPYYNKTQRFHLLPEAVGMLMVGRLDAATAELVRGMIDDAVAVEQTGLRGRAVIDLALKNGAYEEGEEWLRMSAQTYRHNGVPVFVDRYAPLIREDWPLPDTALYFGWYAGEVGGALKPQSFHFKRGAIACHLHSFSASIIRTTTQAWVGPMIAHGAAATVGNVWEPYLSFTVHFDTFNDRLLRGWTLAEAAWCATPGLSWMNVVIGDPLYRPFAHGSMGEGKDRVYSLYKGLVERHSGDKDTTQLKQEVLKLAQTRSDPELIELLSLLSSVESKPGEAVELLQHARSLYTDPQDRLRTVVYEVEILRRERDAKKDKEAKGLLQRTAAESAGKGEGNAALIGTMLRELGG